MGQIPGQEYLDKKLNAAVDQEFHIASWQKVLEASGQGKKRGAALRIASLYKLLNPQDGVESALAPVMISLTEEITNAFGALPLQALRKSGILS